MAFEIALETWGLDELIAKYEAIERDLKNELRVALIGEVQVAVVVAKSLAPTVAVVDSIEKEMLANARRGGSRGGAKGVIWRTEPHRDLGEYIDFVETGDLEVTAGVVGAGQMAREIEFGNRWIAAYPYWRPPIWEAVYRLRQRIEEIIGRALRGV